MSNKHIYRKLYGSLDAFSYSFLSTLFSRQTSDLSLLLGKCLLVFSSSSDLDMSMNNFCALLL